jgi:cold shock CspA family protein
MLEIYYGTVKFFSVPRGFGFIRRTSDGEEFYFHCSELDGEHGERNIEVGTVVEFTLGKYKKEIVAKTVRPLESEGDVL